MSDDIGSSQQPPEPLPGGSRLPPKPPGRTARGLGDGSERGGSQGGGLPFPRFMPLGLFIRILFRKPISAIQLLVGHFKLIYLRWKDKRRRSAIKELRRRKLYFKLPLKQTQFHWNFYDRDAVLSGKLTLVVTGNNRK